MTNEIISLRVGEDIRERMKMVRHINWSALIRKSIEEQLEKESTFDIEKAKRASQDIDRIRKSSVFSGGKSGTEIIREWRNKRRF